MMSLFRLPVRCITSSVILLLLSAPLAASEHVESLLLEAEAFANRGGWVVDTQAMDVMGSPFALAHGDSLSRRPRPPVGA